MESKDENEDSSGSPYCRKPRYIDIRTAVKQFRIIAKMWLN
jgi:hypothetical protein